MSENTDPFWITALSKMSVMIGMNPTQTRWRLVRWNEDRKLPVSERRVAPQRVEEPSRLLSLSTALAVSFMVIFARMWIARGGRTEVPNGFYFDFGELWPNVVGDWWRYLTAAFLHGGVMHILFNVLALAAIGPQVERVWGRTTMLFLFCTTAVVGFVASAAFQPDVPTVGASGGVCGLIGAAAGFGQRLNTSGGKIIRNEMLKWLAYTIIFGFAVKANNWAHAGGALAGAVFGYGVRPRDWKPWMRMVAGSIGVITTVATVVFIVTRTTQW
ncbi:MAG: rhomboid family intramembrane serine protease [Kofleriaceae bacterium]